MNQKQFMDLVDWCNPVRIKRSSEYWKIYFNERENAKEAICLSGTMNGNSKIEAFLI